MTPRRLHLGARCDAPDDKPGIVSERVPPNDLDAEVAAQRHPLRVCKPPLGPDSVSPADPGNDALPRNLRRARSGSKSGDVVVDLPVERIISDLDADGRQRVASAARLTPDELEAIAQRLAALLLRGA
jgi:hypothetical protein